MNHDLRLVLAARDDSARIYECVLCLGRVRIVAPSLALIWDRRYDGLLAEAAAEGCPGGNQQESQDDVRIRALAKLSPDEIRALGITDRS